MTEEKKDTYKTITVSSPEVLHKDKKSKFYGYAFPILNEEEVKPIIESLRKKHHTANHVCYAWQLGVENIKYRANDDGEPNNSAGTPIYGQIKSFDVTNVLVAVARIFGGTKLGVGGLISTYKTAAQMALETSSIIEKTLQQHFLVSFDYKEMNTVMRIIKQHKIKITSQKMETNCVYTIAVRKQEAKQIHSIFNALQHIAVKEID